VSRFRISSLLFFAAMISLAPPVLGQSAQKGAVPSVREVSNELNTVRQEYARAAEKARYWRQQVEIFQRSLQNAQQKGILDQSIMPALQNAQQQLYESEKRRDALDRYLRQLMEYQARVQMDGPGAGPPPWTKSRPSMPYPVGAGFPKSPHREAALASIEGDWILHSGGQGQDIVITVNYFPRDGSYTGVLTHPGNIKFHVLNDVIFKVQPVPETPGSFAGTEYGFDQTGHRKNSRLLIVVKGGEMTYISGNDRQKLIRP
jgi:hypothetical protein